MDSNRKTPSAQKEYKSHITVWRVLWSARSLFTAEAAAHLHEIEMKFIFTSCWTNWSHQNFKKKITNWNLRQNQSASSPTFTKIPQMLTSVSWCVEATLHLWKSCENSLLGVLEVLGRLINSPHRWLWQLEKERNMEVRKTKKDNTNWSLR